MEESADKHEGMCRSSQFSLVILFLVFLFLFSRANAMAILALGRFPGSCANAIGRHAKKKEYFPRGTRWKKGYVCVAPTFAVQLLTE